MQNELLKDTIITPRALKILTFGGIFSLLALLTGAISMLLGGSYEFLEFAPNMLNLGMKSLIITVGAALFADYIISGQDESS